MGGSASQNTLTTIYPQPSTQDFSSKSRLCHSLVWSVINSGVDYFVHWTEVPKTAKVDFTAQWTGMAALHGRILLSHEATCKALEPALFFLIFREFLNKQDLSLSLRSALLRSFPEVLMILGKAKVQNPRGRVFLSMTLAIIRKDVFCACCLKSCKNVPVFSAFLLTVFPCNACLLFSCHLLMLCSGLCYPNSWSDSLILIHPSNTPSPFAHEAVCTAEFVGFEGRVPPPPMF